MRSRSFRRILLIVIRMWWVKSSCVFDLHLFLCMPSLLVGEQVQGAIVEVSLLQGDEEEAYWEETNRTPPPAQFFLVAVIFRMMGEDLRMAEQ